MTIKKKSNLFTSILLILSLVVIMGVFFNYKNSSADGKVLSTVHMDGSYSIDVNDPQQTVGDADYVFVARVDKVEDTVYKHTVQIETKDGTKEISTPYTNYRVTVLKNIKGSLETDTSIPIQKAGGIDQDNSSIVLYEDDILPEVNKTYVFLGYAQDDGTLLVSGPNSNEFVENVNKAATSGIEASDVVSKYKKAYDHQKFTHRDRSKSKFDTHK